MFGAYNWTRTSDLSLTKGVLYHLSYAGNLKCNLLPESRLERVMGIEPTQSAWKAEVLPLNYTRLIYAACQIFATRLPCSLSHTSGQIDLRQPGPYTYSGQNHYSAQNRRPGVPRFTIQLPSENDGGGGRIRTYVGIASRFTVCPR
jgi:hypothetical protein